MGDANIAVGISSFRYRSDVCVGLILCNPSLDDGRTLSVRANCLCSIVIGGSMLSLEVLCQQCRFLIFVVVSVGACVCGEMGKV
jgi:uncharacterized membrane protein YccC